MQGLTGSLDGDTSRCSGDADDESPRRLRCDLNLAIAARAPQVGAQVLSPVMGRLNVAWNRNVLRYRYAAGWGVGQRGGDATQAQVVIRGCSEPLLWAARIDGRVPCQKGRVAGRCGEGPRGAEDQAGTDNAPISRSTRPHHRQQDADARREWGQQSGVLLGNQAEDEQSPTSHRPATSSPRRV